MLSGDKQTAENDNLPAENDYFPAENNYLPAENYYAENDNTLQYPPTPQFPHLTFERVIT